ELRRGRQLPVDGAARQPTRLAPYLPAPPPAGHERRSGRRARSCCARTLGRGGHHAREHRQPRSPMSRLPNPLVRRLRAPTRERGLAMLVVLLVLMMVSGTAIFAMHTSSLELRAA